MTTDYFMNYFTRVNFENGECLYIYSIFYYTIYIFFFVIYYIRIRNTNFLEIMWNKYQTSDKCRFLVCMTN